MGGGPGGPEAGLVTISFVEFQDQQLDGFETLAILQETIANDIAGADISVDKAEEGPATGPPVNVELVGSDPDLLSDLADEVIATLQADPVYAKLVRLNSNLDDARPELGVQVDREKAALYGLSTLRVGQAIRGAIQGIEAAKYRTGNDEYDIVVRLAEEDRDELSALTELTVLSDGDPIPLLSVASWEVGQGAGSIQRLDMDRSVTVSSEVRAGYNSNAVLGEVQQALSDFAEGLPPGYQIRYTGENEEQAEAQAFLTTAFLMALFLIGFILISQFNSLVKPLIILTSVIMSTVGVLLGLMVFRMPFGIIMTGVGVISLAGIVVNNAIVLVDYVNTLRRRDGLPRLEAVLEAGRLRFRPILMTTSTTVLALLPMALGIGEGAEIRAPMAITVIGGLLLSTVLTLVVVPVVYTLLDRSPS
jgi:multidrug efflux pump subunit AcrB